MIMGSSHTRTCDKRSSPHTPSLQHHTAWPETRGGVQRFGHKVQGNYFWSGGKHTTLFCLQGNKTGKLKHNSQGEGALQPGSSQPPQPRAAKGQAGRVSCRGSLPEDHGSRSCRIIRPVAGGTRTQPNL